MHLLIAVLFILLMVLIGIIPFIILYGFSSFLQFLFSRVFKYRRKVIQDNLKKCFPNKDQSEIDFITKKFYRNLSDIFIESIKSFVMTKAQINKRHKTINPEVISQFIENNKSVIVTVGHYGNWEWGSLSAGLQSNAKVIGLYKPLSNKYIDRFIKWSRSRYGTTLTPINKTTITFSNLQAVSTIYLMAADQNPANPDKAYWVNFLGRDTAFLHGVEKHSKDYNIPVVFADIQRRKRGFYELEITLLCENPQELPEGEITRRYVNKLEEVIIKKPENWLWSHRRWKHKRS